MKRLLAIAVMLAIGWATGDSIAHATPKHTGPTKKTHTSYNPTSHLTQPIIGREISRSEPSKPPIINVKVEWDGKCLQLLNVTSGNVIWEICP